MHRSKHARDVAERFRELVEASGDSLVNTHYDELALLIEAAIDTTLVEQLEVTAKQLETLAHDLRNNAEFFEEQT